MCKNISSIFSRTSEASASEFISRKYWRNVSSELHTLWKYGVIPINPTYDAYSDYLANTKVLFYHLDILKFNDIIMCKSYIFGFKAFHMISSVTLNSCLMFNHTCTKLHH